MLLFSGVIGIYQNMGGDTAVYHTAKTRVPGMYISSRMNTFYITYTLYVYVSTFLPRIVEIKMIFTV